MNNKKQIPEAPQTPACQIRAVRNRVAALLKHESRKLEKQRAEALETGQHGRYGQIADSLMANPAAAPRGTATAEIVNIHTEETETVSLNPAFDAVKNAALLYRKARKGKRGHSTVTAMLAETEAKAERLRETLEEVDGILKRGARDAAAADRPCAHTDEDIERVRELAKEFLPPEEGKAGKNKTQTAPVPFRKFVIDGWEIYLGKSSAQNDELSTRFANPWDIWMHVVGYAGSHVIIRRKKDTPPPPKEIIEKTAQLAVWHSKAKHTSFAEVHITEARFVRKRRHAPAGEVIAERCKTVRVEPKDPQTLKLEAV